MTRGDRGYELANDSQFRETLGGALPTVYGVVTAANVNGSYTVAVPDGEEATAWPLSGASYTAGDGVYVLFSNQSPDSGVLLGKKRTPGQFWASALRVSANGAPASASDTGEIGQIAWDGDYVYVCVDVDTWKRAALLTW